MVRVAVFNAFRVLCAIAVKVTTEPLRARRKGFR
jgi:hypothetical protein